MEKQRKNSQNGFAHGIRLHHFNHYYEVITFKQYSTSEEQL